MVQWWKSRAEPSPSKDAIATAPESQSAANLAETNLPQWGGKFVLWEDIEPTPGPDGKMSRLIPPDLVETFGRSWIVVDGIWFGALPPHCIYASDGKSWGLFRQLNPETAPEYFRGDGWGHEPRDVVAFGSSLDVPTGKIWRELPPHSVYDQETGTVYQRINPETAPEFYGHRKQVLTLDSWARSEDEPETPPAVEQRGTPSLSEETIPFRRPAPEQPAWEFTSLGRYPGPRPRVLGPLPKKTR